MCSYISCGEKDGFVSLRSSLTIKSSISGLSMLAYGVLPRLKTSQHVMPNDHCTRGERERREMEKCQGVRKDCFYSSGSTVCMCMCVHVRVCVHVCACVCMCECVCILTTSVISLYRVSFRHSGAIHLIGSFLLDSMR